MRNVLMLVAGVIGMLVATSAVAWGQSASASTIYVDQNNQAAEDSALCGRTQQTPCKTISQGVMNATAGDTVSVASGTYQEAVTIGKQLTLTGAGSSGDGATIVQAPSGTIDATDNPCGTSNGGPRRAVICVHDADGSTVQDLHIDGNGAGAANRPAFFGLVLYNGGGTVQNLAVTGVREDPLNGIQSGNAILADGGSGDTTYDDLTIKNNTVSDYQKNGIIVEDKYTGATVDGNTVTGAGPQDQIAQNGIQFSFGAVGSVTHNTVTGNECNQASCGSDPINDTQSGGVLVAHAGSGTSVSQNTITNNDDGVLDSDSDGSSITGNTFSGNRYAGVYVDTGTVGVSGNTIANAGNALGIVGVAYQDPNGTSPTVNAIGNDITGQDRGIEALDEDRSRNEHATVTAHANRIVGNTNGYANASGTDQDATENFWGCNGGPGTAGCDTAVGVGGAAAPDFDPFLVLSAGANPNRVQTGGSSTVTGTVAHDNHGASPSVASQFPSGIPVAFAADRGTVNPASTTTTGPAATTRFTAPSQPGTATVTAKLDNATASAPIQVTSAVNPARAGGHKYVGRDADGRLEVFAISGGRLVDYAQQSAGGSFSGGTVIGTGNFVGTPAVRPFADGRLAVFVTDGSTGTVRYAVQSQPGRAFGALQSLGAPDSGGRAPSGPALASNADGRLEVFVRNQNGGISTKYQTSPNGPFTASWGDLHGRTAGAPAAGNDRDGRIELFARDRDGGGVTNWFQHSPNSGIVGPRHGLPAASVTSDPEVGRNADGRVEVFIRHAGDGDVLTVYQHQPGGAFSSPFRAMNAPGGFGTPAAAQNADGRLEVFARNGGTGISTSYQTSPNGSFTRHWADLGGRTLPTDPATLPDAASRIALFAVSDAHQLINKRQDDPNGSFPNDYTTIGPAD